MLFLQFVQYSLSFAGTPKNEIPGAALELCHLKIKQFSPDILKFSTKREENPFTLNCFKVRRTFLLIFHAGSRRLGSNNFRNSGYKEKTAGSARVSGLSFRFLWLCSKIAFNDIYNKQRIFKVNNKSTKKYCKYLLKFNQIPKTTWKTLLWYLLLSILDRSHSQFNALDRQSWLSINF